MIFTCASILVIGYIAGQMFDLRWPLPWACGLALLIWTVFVATCGMLTAFQSLEHARFVRIEDGRKDVLITLKLGPFSYTVNVPAAKEPEE